MYKESINLKNEEASYKTISSLIKIARKHFTECGYFDVSLEKIAEEGNVTRGAVYHHFKSKKGLLIAVLESVQKDVVTHIETEASKGDDPWQQLIFGCVGFIKGANAKDNRRIFLIDAPAALGWEIWRKYDRENSMNALEKHIIDLKVQGYLKDSIDTELMTFSISGALNELALAYSENDKLGENDPFFITISQLVSGFKK